MAAARAKAHAAGSRPSAPSTAGRKHTSAGNNEWAKEHERDSDLQEGGHMHGKITIIKGLTRLAKLKSVCSNNAL